MDALKGVKRAAMEADRVKKDEFEKVNTPTPPLCFKEKCPAEEKGYGWIEVMLDLCEHEKQKNSRGL